MNTSTPIAFFNILMVTNPMGNPEVIERHVFDMTKGQTKRPAMKAREILKQWTQAGDKLETLDSALIKRHGVELELIPVVIVTGDGETVDIFGQWLIPA